MRDPYEVLGVEKDASPDDIKKAYRALAKKWHPDRNQDNKQEAEARFKEISAAYEILGDPDKRRRHDSMSSFGDGVEFGFPPFWNVDDVLNTFRRQSKGKNVRAMVELTLEEVAKGGEHTFSIPRKSECTPCKGTGAEGASTRSCASCGGLGFRQVRQNHGGIFVQSRSQCFDCGGSGRVPSVLCSICHGAGFVEKKETITVSVPPGVNQGDLLRLAGRGHPGPGGPGDLLLVVSVAPHDRFQRRGNDLLSTIKIPFLTALAGGSVEVDDLMGERLEVSIPRACPYGHEIVLPGRGICNGDIRVHVSFELPALDKDKIKAVSDLLG